MAHICPCYDQNNRSLCGIHHKPAPTKPVNYVKVGNSKSVMDFKTTVGSTKPVREGKKKILGTSGDTISPVFKCQFCGGIATKLRFRPTPDYELAYDLCDRCAEDHRRVYLSLAPKPKRRGRPKGSKNKPKDKFWICKEHGLSMLVGFTCPDCNKRLYLHPQIRPCEKIEKANLNAVFGYDRSTPQDHYLEAKINEIIDYLNDRQSDTKTAWTVQGGSVMLPERRCSHCSCKTPKCCVCLNDRKEQDGKEGRSE